MSQAFAWQVLMSCRIPRLILGWATQVCAAVLFGTVMFTPALSYTHYCCVPDSHPIPQARLPRLHGQFEPVLPVYITTHVAGLPDYIKTWDNVYTMRSCVHYSSLMESSKSSPLRFHSIYRRFRRRCVITHLSPQGLWSPSSYEWPRP